ncbi:MAG TPA: hypothetical protein VM032_07845 [Vicinamibacterales bacterium]|nr:hypothetical protein [Vicinamibacterales bacterium]
MRRVTSGFITTSAGIAAIVTGLAVIDERVRGEVAALASGHARAGDIAGVGGRMQELGLVALYAVRDQSIEHAPLTLFALVALVLFVLMLRT